MHHVVLGIDKPRVEVALKHHHNALDRGIRLHILSVEGKR